MRFIFISLNLFLITLVMAPESFARTYRSFNPETGQFDGPTINRRGRLFEVFDIPDQEEEPVHTNRYSRDNPINNSKIPAPRKKTNHSQLNCVNPQGAFACLACNCVNEAAPRWDDQLAVSKVVMTRVQLPQYPNSVCGVVKQRLQFSWFNQRSTRRSVPKDHACFTAATEALKFRGYFADHYHANYVNPKWAKRMRKVDQVGVHIYYSTFPPSQIRTIPSDIEV